MESVVPANAGTHNHRLSLLHQSRRTAPLNTGAAAYGSLRSQGRRSEIRLPPAPNRRLTRLSTPARKNILFFRINKSVYTSPRPAPTRGALAIVTNAGRDAVDADHAKDEGA